MNPSIGKIREDDFDVPKSHESNPFSNDVGSFEGRPPDNSPPFDQSATTSKANNEDNFETKGSINFEMKLHNDPEENKEGAVIAMEKSDMKLQCSIPSKSGSNYFASFQGNTGFMKLRGFGTTTLSFGYLVWDGAALLYDWNTMDGLSKSSFGASYKNGKSKTQAKLQYPSSKKTTTESTVLSLQNSTNISNVISSEVEVGIASNPKKFSSLSTLRMGFKTIHDEALPHIQIYIDYFHKLPLKVCYQQPINLVEQSSTEISFAVGKNRFEIKALLSQSLDKFSKFSVGVGHSTWEGLAWIFRLEKGDLTLNIPIQITSFATTGYSTLVYSISTAYLSLLSGIIHTIMGEVLERTRKVVSSEMKKEEKLLFVGKARQDAESQIMLMKRKADLNQRSEDAKGGLLIEKATYSVEGGNCLDVMIPLQFWVVDSRLNLAASSFGGMLGFYDIRQNQTSSDSPSSRTTGGGDNLGLVGLWNSLFEDSSTEEKVPILYVKYRFNGKLFDLNTMDNEALILPSRRAIEVQAG